MQCTPFIILLIVNIKLTNPLCTFHTKFKTLTPVDQTLDSTIHRANHYLVDKYEGNQLCYPLDRDLLIG